MTTKPTYKELEERIAILEQENISRLRNEEEKNLALSLLHRAEKVGRSGSWSIDLETWIEKWSKGEYRLHGIPSDAEASFDLHLQCVHPDDRDRHLRVFKENLLSNKTHFSQSYRIQTKDKEIRYIKAEYQIIRDPKGEALKAYGTDKDVTKHKESKQALEKSKFLFSQMFEQSTTSICLYNPKGDIINVNDKFCEMFGVTNEAILKGQYNVFEDRATIDGGGIPYLKRIFQQKKTQSWKISFDIELASKSSNISSEKTAKIDLEIFCYPLLNNDGELEYVVLQHYDITERNRTEKALKRTGEELRSIFRAAPTGIGLVSNRIVLRVNDRICEMTGYKRSELINQNARILYPTDEDFEYVGKEKYRQISKYGTGTVETRWMRKDGEILHILMSSTPLDQKDLSAGVTFTALDITHLKTVEAQLRQAHKMEAIGTLAGGIAHDFNNLLFPIIGMAELLLENVHDESQKYKFIQHILNAGRRGSDLVKQIMALGRQTEHKFHPVSIQSILKEVLKLTRATIPTYIEIKEEIQNDCDKIMADPTQIHQLVMNLMTNAFHAVEADGGKIIVQLKEVFVPHHELKDISLLPGRYAVLSIHDTGHGIPHKLLDRIFEPYFTTKEKGKGTGLGLATVYGIVKEHKGDIKVNSEENKGTSFDIFLPLLDKSVDKDGSYENTFLPKGTESILLVDDEEPIATLLKAILEGLGYKVTMCLNSLETLDLFKTNADSFDLVISDMAMPNMTGDQLAIEIRKMRLDIPIIICTGYSERLSELNSDELQIDSILMKPVAKSKLATTVRKVLDEAKS